ncbi:topoisomerase (DNA) III beta, partial [Monoraphidium neglectum]
GGDRLALEWERGRVFDQDVAGMFLANVKDARALKVGRLVVSVTSKEERRPRPHGLNTVELLKAASSSLNMGPAHAMQAGGGRSMVDAGRMGDGGGDNKIAERLYTSGYLSYPRTESSAYPENFDLQTALRAQARQPLWGQYAQAVIAAGAGLPKGGVDAGDHPPITPVEPATEEELGGGDAWRLYDFCARWFLASVSPDCVVRKTKAVLSGGGEAFVAGGTVVLKPGFTAIMPWRAPQAEPLPVLQEGESLPLQAVELVQGKTSPPDYLTEAELIERMEKHGIGTDASIPTHINNIVERNYVKVEPGRRVVPTELGVTLIKGYQLIDGELCKPQVRAHVEAQINLVAQGQAKREAVVAHTLEQFRAKFAFFVAHISRMDALFEASFSPLSSSGRPMSKCGKCRRYMKFIGARPQRLYCPTCEDVYALPQGGQIKQYKGLTCPLDGFELLLFSLAGQDGKTYPLCPLCFSYPPFEGAVKVGGEGASMKPGMPCTTCLHPTCPECQAGMLVLDPVSGPKWRLDCRQLLTSFAPPYLPPPNTLECASRLLQLEFRKGASAPGLLAGGETGYEGCVACDEQLAALCEVKHGRTWVNRGGGGRRGRGRGRRGRGRGRGRNIDPKMSFDQF